ncbi:MAG: hypothetical protein VKK99_05625, partial [Cyanobacteriota bacterium]|nr:hypothetical protein [Cyanobacteriota bacterium]
GPAARQDVPKRLIQTMAASEAIIGEEWKARSQELATWAMERLVNRKDVWGQYSLLAPHEAREQGRTYRAMTLPIASMRGEDMVTLDKLTRHFASRRQHRPQLIGLHAESKEGTSRWLAIDIDNHDLEAVGAAERARRNLAGALEWWRLLAERGYDPMLFDSSGKGGFHLWVLFAEPAPTPHVWAMVKALATTWERHQLEEEPEIFPKQPKPGSLNAWFRLPGMHHTQPHYSRMWSGEEWLSEPWLEGHAAIDAMLQAIPGPPPPVPDGGSTPTPAGPERTATARKRRFAAAQKPRVCLDVDGVLADRTYGRGAEDLGDPIAGAVEFTRALAEKAEVVIHSARLSAGDSSSAAGRKAEARLRDWLDHHGFEYHTIATGVGKPVASAYVDDRGVSCRPMDDGPRAFEQALLAVERLCAPPEPAP